MKIQSKGLRAVVGFYLWKQQAVRVFELVELDLDHRKIKLRYLFYLNFSFVIFF
ncbi:hypothetical protein M8C21_015043 [Ambrosia artemisiifolia]|uniref:Uncharacterized protein n=1 Tax=Ambrosia artemisiifolia TaxID=4212 RepID=A0AAD5GM76_AMBAR|nr:hypothetical protein M8C21_015043 [Ambrosia artemisiifolia]